jgi:hypothetical protein
VYLFDTPVLKGLNGLEIYEDYKDVIIFLKTVEQDRKKIELFFKWTTQIHFIKGIGDI